jgi:predicted ATPase
MQFSRFLLIAIETQGYKGFSDWEKITLSDLTLIYGENSAGKSSAMRLLVSIARAVKKKSRYPLLPVDIDRSEKNFSSLFTNSQSSPLKLRLFFQDPKTGDSFNLEYAIQYIREKNSALITDFSIQDYHGNNWKYEIDTDYSPTNTFARKYFASRNDIKIDADLRFEFHGLAPEIYHSKGCDDALSQDLSSATENAYWALSQLANSIVWIGPLRYMPSRHSTLTCFPEDFSPDGREVLQLLHSANYKGDEIVNQCSNWFDNATKRLLSVTPSVESNIEVFSIFLAPKEAPAMQIPISEHGAGMSQVLPIVVLCVAASLKHSVFHTSPLLIFENPELHLHDAVHESLARLFLQTVESGDVRIIAETHSENVLLTTQIAELEKSPENKKTISVNWVRKNETGYSEITQFHFDKNGSLGGLWSRSIFSYTPELARRVMMLKMKKKAIGENDAN